MRPTIKIFGDKYELYAEPNMKEEIAIETEMVSLLSVLGGNGYDRLAELDKAIMDAEIEHNKTLLERHGDKLVEKQDQAIELEKNGKMDSEEYQTLFRELYTDALAKVIRHKRKKNITYYFAFFEIMSVKPITDEAQKDFKNNQDQFVKEMSEKLKGFREKEK